MPRRHHGPGHSFLVYTSESFDRGQGKTGYRMQPNRGYSMLSCSVQARVPYRANRGAPILIPAGGWDIVLRKAKVEIPAKKPIPFETELTGLNQNQSSQMT